MEPVEIKPKVYWVGAVDWNIRTFHGHTYTTRRGTTYNAYLIVDEKIALVDTVHGPFTQEMLERIKQIVPLEKIDYIIANHVETDHTGALVELHKACPKAVVYGTAKCQEGLAKHYPVTWQFKVVKTGDTLSLGKRTLHFIEASMIHWPDSMFTYLAEEKLLLPNDAFGQHYATSERFDDEVNEPVLMEEAAKYYANILWPLSTLIAKKIDEVKKMGVPIDMIAPSHGIIWRANPGKIIDAYVRWSQNTTQPCVVIAYETMWGSTDTMARAMAQGIRDAGVSVTVREVTQYDRTDVITEMLGAKGYLFGSSTHDNDMLSTMAAFLHFLKGLKPKNRIAAAFGSIGWAGGAVQSIEATLKEAGIEIASAGLSVQFVPNQQEKLQCYEFGQQFAKKIKGG